MPRPLSDYVREFSARAAAAVGHTDWNIEVLETAPGVVVALDDVTVGQTHLASWRVVLCAAAPASPVDAVDVGAFRVVRFTLTEVKDVDGCLERLAAAADDFAKWLTERERELG